MLCFGEVSELSSLTSVCAGAQIEMCALWTEICSSRSHLIEFYLSHNGFQRRNLLNVFCYYCGMELLNLIKSVQ